METLLINFKAIAVSFPSFRTGAGSFVENYGANRSMILILLCKPRAWFERDSGGGI